MVYESDFYTTRRPYRPSSTYSSVTVSVPPSVTPNHAHRTLPGSRAPSHQLDFRLVLRIRLHDGGVSRSFPSPIRAAFAVVFISDLT